VSERGDGGAGEAERLDLGPAGGAFDEALRALERERAVERAWARDAGLWSDDPAVRAKIADRLGWLDVAERMRGEAEDLAVFGREIREAGFARVVVLGMGGSSLCVEVLRLAFGSAEGFPALTVLDTTDPATIRALSDELDLRQTLFVVASKSGGTLETLSHAAYFFEQVTAARGDGAGAQFIAITDPGSKLAVLGEERGYRRVFLNPPDIGGRYSVLSYFGLVPAALAGIDVARLLDSATRMMAACRRPAAENPGARLGALIGGLARAGRDKLTLVTSPAIAAFGDWAEQLIAESTGKEGRGIVPIVGEALGASAAYGDDRLFVHLYLRQDDRPDLALEGLAALGQPSARLDLADMYDLGAEFFRWEFATALAGKLLGSNPFDEPNVQESKDNTNRLLAKHASAGRLPEPPPAVTADGVALGWGDAADPPDGRDLAGAFGDFLAGVRPGDYLALMAYFAATPEQARALGALRLALRDRLRVATTLGYGPRFLHSTGQLHKGGANNGVFIQLVAPGADGDELPIPGQGYGFGTLKAAQALGDLQSLRAHGRRVVRLDLDGDIAGGLQLLGDALERAARGAAGG
jgi:glucose-6-phosphate isomerase